jgi:hypothetical protein
MELYYKIVQGSRFKVPGNVVLNLEPETLNLELFS